MAYRLVLEFTANSPRSVHVPTRKETPLGAGVAVEPVVETVLPLTQASSLLQSVEFPW
jgi:hypothetical protein